MLTVNLSKGKQLRKGLFLFGIFIFFCIASIHLTCPPANAYLSNFPVENIEESVFNKWLIINYFKKKLSGAYKSEIINSDFFISSEGRTNPHAEFLAFKDLLISYLETGDHQEVLCRFPARMTLFANSYDWLDRSKLPECFNFQTQTQPDQIVSVSLIFASGYYDNPASYFGHLYLKFNYKKETPFQSSLDSGLGFGANVTDSDLNPLYLIKGIFGGYEATYKRNNHFIYSYNYTNKQIRDVWEFELNLTAEQIEFLSEHSWELMNAKFDYYFFNDNCANRIAKIIELATGLDLSKTYGLWLMPLQVIRNIGNYDKNSSPNLVKREVYHPSLKKTFFEHFKTLNNLEKEEFTNFIGLTNNQKKEAVNALDSKILILALNYLDLQVAKQTTKSKDEEKLADLQSQRSIILGALLHHPSQSIQTFKEIKRPTESLLTSQPSSTIRIGYGIREEFDFLKINYRAANNDFLNTPGPGQEVSKFLAVAIEAEIAEHSIDITEFALLDIVSLNTNPLPWTLTHEFSWDFKIDYAPRNNICIDCSTFGTEAKFGTAARLSSDILLYGLAGGRLHTRLNNQKDIFSFILEAGTIINLPKNLILWLEGNYYYDPASESTEYLLKANLGYNFSKNYDFRMSIEGDGQDLAAIARLGYYFD